MLQPALNSLAERSLQRLGDVHSDEADPNCTHMLRLTELAQPVEMPYL